MNKERAGGITFEEDGAHAQEEREAADAEAGVEDRGLLRRAKDGGTGAAGRAAGGGLELLLAQPAQPPARATTL